MAKRDYRSYNILGDELQKETNLQPSDQKDNKEKEINQLDSIEEVDVLQEKIDISQPFIEVSTTKESIGIDKEPIEEVKLAESNNSSSIDSDFEKKVNNDTSFSNYKDNYQKKERSRLVKWGLRLSKFIIILMLLPFIGIILSAVLTFLGFFIAGIVGSFGLGIFLIGVTSFFATQISVLLIALGITSSITALSFGAILTILFIMMIKQVRSLLQKYRKPKRTRTIQEGR